MFSLIAKDKTWPISELNWPPRYLVLVASKTNGRAGSRILGIKGPPDQADLQINAFKSDSRSNAKSSQDTEMNLHTNFQPSSNCLTFLVIMIFVLLSFDFEIAFIALSGSCCNIPASDLKTAFIPPAFK